MSNSSEFNDALWQAVCSSLRARVGESEFRSWFQMLHFLGVSDGRAMLGVPTAFLKDWISNNYEQAILNAFRANMPDTLSVDFVLVPRKSPGEKAQQTDIGDRQPEPQKSERRTEDLIIDGEAEEVAVKSVTKAPAPARAVRAKAKSSEESPLNDICSPLEGTYTFDNFVVGKPNELAYAAARRVADNDDVAFNPLFLYGGVGLGKTHLMHAIAWQIRERTPERRVAYLPAEAFMNRFIKALRFKDTVSFKEQFRNVDVLMIDDLQFFSDKDSTQEEFFHTFNALVEQNRQVIISADRSPEELGGLEERIRSRLGWGMVADIHPTDYELRLGVITSLVEKLPGIVFPREVIEFLAHRVVSNVRVVEGAVTRIVASHRLIGRAITMELVHEVLADLLRSTSQVVTIESIQKRVAEHFHIKVSDMTSPRRARAVARPRQVAMHLAKKLTSRSLPEIGRHFGNRDHTTVLHAVRRIESLIESDMALAEDLRLLEASLTDRGLRR